MSQEEYKAKIDDPNVDFEEIYGPYNYTYRNVAKKPEMLRDVKQLHKIPYDILRLMCEFGVMTDRQIISHIVTSILTTDNTAHNNIIKGISAVFNGMFPDNQFESIQHGIIRTSNNNEILVHYYENSRIPQIFLSFGENKFTHIGVSIYFKSNECHVTYDKSINVILKPDMSLQKLIASVMSSHDLTMNIASYEIIKIARLWFCYIC